jgi:hypothetical protein
VDATEARDHLEMVDRILTRAEEPCPLSPFPFLVWGVAGAIMNVVIQLVIVQNGSPWLYTIFGGALILAVALTIAWSFRLRAVLDAGTLVNRQVFNALNLAWIVALIAQLGAPRIFPEWAQAALWLLMYGAAMALVGLLVRSRPVVIGGFVMLASIVVANFALPYAGYVLALGDLIGMAGAGIVLYVSRS